MEFLLVVDVTGSGVWSCTIGAWLMRPSGMLILTAGEDRRNRTYVVRMSIVTCRPDYRNLHEFPNLSRVV